MNLATKIRELSLIDLGLLWESPNFSLNFCRVYHTSGALGHMYGLAHGLEAIVVHLRSDFAAKIRELFPL